MNLFEKVHQFIRSAGHAVESEEHKLLNEFVTFIGEKNLVAEFLQSKGLYEDSNARAVIGTFASVVVPPVETPAPVVADTPADPVVTEKVTNGTVAESNPAPVDTVVDTSVAPDAQVVTTQAI